MKPLPHNKLRIARPTLDLRAAERFWVSGLGLEVLHRAEPAGPGQHPLLMVGWPDAVWHLELVGEAGPPTPTEQDLLVLYLGAAVDEGAVARLVELGGRRVAAANPYWERWGVTIADPDGYRLVLSERSWG